MSADESDRAQTGIFELSKTKLKKGIFPLPASFVFGRISTRRRYTTIFLHL